MKLLFRLMLMLALLLPAPIARADEASTALEYKVKAVVLFNFAKYVKWPEKAFKTPEQPVQVCIAGTNPFGDIFTSEEAPKEAQGRPFKVKMLEASAVTKDASDCQILFWKKSDADEVEGAIQGLHDGATLTVGDYDSDKSLISFVVKDGKVRFKIRRKAAEALGFEMSSQLLKLAIVDDD